MKKTYKDFNIGQIVTCVSIGDESESEYYKDILTIGKKYRVEDVEIYFPNSIAIRTDNNSITFVQLKFFIDNNEVRKEKLNQLNNVK